MSASITPPGQDHAALRFVIRGTGLLLALASALASITVVLSVIARLFAHHQPLGIFGALMGCLMAAVPLLFTKIGFDMFRTADATAVENFSFIFAVLTAFSLYHLVPFRFSQAHEYVWLLAFLSFFGFRRIYMARLLSLLDLQPRRPAKLPSSPNPPDILHDSIPEFPEKSPLTQL